MIALEHILRCNLFDGRLLQSSTREGVEKEELDTAHGGKVTKAVGSENGYNENGGVEKSKVWLAVTVKKTKFSTVDLRFCQR